MATLATLSDTDPSMSISSDIHFSFHKSQSSSSTFVHFPFDRYKDWVVSAGTADSGQALSDIKRILQKAGIETDNVQREAARPSTAPAFAFNVAALTEALCKRVTLAEAQSSAGLLRNILKRYEEDILSTVRLGPDTRVSKDCDALEKTLAAHKLTRGSSAGSNASTVGGLYELALEARLSTLRASEDLNAVRSVAKAKCELSRRIDRLDAVLVSLRERNAESDSYSVASEAWCTFKDSETAPYRIEYQQAHKAVAGATREMNAARQKLEKACDQDSLLTCVSNIPTEELKRGFPFFRGQIFDYNYPLEASKESPTDDHNVTDLPEKSELRVRFADSTGDTQDDQHADSDADEKADECGGSQGDKPPEESDA